MKNNIVSFCKTLVVIFGMLLFCSCQEEGSTVRLNSSSPCVSDGVTGITAGITGQRICDDNINSSSSKSTSYNNSRSRDSSWKTAGGSHNTPNSSGGSNGNTIVNICNRNDLVVAAILDKITRTPKPRCFQVTKKDLAEITELSLKDDDFCGALAGSFGSTASPKTANDFKGLTGIITLNLSCTSLIDVPDKYLDELTSITTLEIEEMHITSAALEKMLKTIPRPRQFIRLNTDDGDTNIFCPKAGGLFISQELTNFLGGSSSSSYGNCQNNGCILTRTSPYSKLVVDIFGC